MKISSSIFWTFVFLLGFSLNLSAQLAGQYTIGTGEDYETITDAVNDLGSVGISASVQFILEDTEYDEGVTIKDFARFGRLDDEVRFVKSAALSDVLWFNTNADINSNWVVKLEGADYVVFEDISFHAFAPGGVYGVLMVLEQAATHVSVFNCLLSGLEMVGNGAADLIIQGLGNNEHFTVSGSVLEYGFAGIDFAIDPNLPASDHQVYIDNVFRYQRISGIRSRGIETIVSNNNFLTNSDAFPEYNALWIASSGSQINSNRLILYKGSTGMELSYGGDTSSSEDRVYNNMVSLLSPDGEAGILSTMPAAAIVHNTVYVDNSSTAYGLWIDDSDEAIEVSNNILYHVDGGTAYRVNRTQDLATSDYNDIYSTAPILAIKTNLSNFSLRTWLGFTGFDVHSVDQEVDFNSESSLYLDAGSNGQGQLSATPHPFVTVDIQGQPRAQGTFAYMGADEEELNLGVTLELDVFLDGPFDGTEFMSTLLNSSSTLTESASFNPYYNSPYECGDPVSVFNGYFELNADIVDWVCIELRTGLPGSEDHRVAANQVGFLLSDGRIRWAGTGSLEILFKASWQDHYVIVKHRNHLAAMSAAPQNFSDGTGQFSFNSGDVYGTNPMRVLPSGKKTLWAGDGNGDGSVTAFDFISEFLPINGLAMQYSGGDFNMDSNGTAFDFILGFLPSNGLFSQVPDVD